MRISERSERDHFSAAFVRGLQSVDSIPFPECVEYQEPVYERISVSVGLGSKPIEKKILRCPLSHVPLIVGGEGSFPCHWTHFAEIEF